MAHCTHTVHIHCTAMKSDKQGIEQEGMNRDEQGIIADGTLYTEYEVSRQSVNVDDKETVQQTNMVHIQTSGSTQEGMNCSQLRAEDLHQKTLGKRRRPEENIQTKHSHKITNQGEKKSGPSLFNGSKY